MIAVCLRYVLGTWDEVLDMFRICFGYVLGMCGTFLGEVLDMIEACLEVVWGMLGVC